MTTQRRQAFAILRDDEFQGSTVPIENRVTVKCVVWTLADAQQQVERLNHLNSSKGCRYFWQATRVLDGEQSEDVTNDA